MKKVEAYQTNDGKTFLKKSAARSHENRLRYESKVKEIETYLFDLLEIKKLDNNGDIIDDRDEQLSDMLMDKGISSLLESAEDANGIAKLMIDVATILDGALLKTAQYAKEITSK